MNNKRPPLTPTTLEFPKVLEALSKKGRKTKYVLLITSQFWCQNLSLCVLVPNWILETRVLGDVGKNSFIALPSPTWWARSRKWWKTGKPCRLQFKESDMIKQLKNNNCFARQRGTQKTCAPQRCVQGLHSFFFLEKKKLLKNSWLTMFQVHSKVSNHLI